MRTPQPTTARPPWARLAVAAVALAVALAGQTIAGHFAPLTAHADTTFDSALFTLINQDRANAGVAPLRWNSQLGGIAEYTQYGGCGFTIAGRARDMINRNYFSHTICGSQTVFNIMQADGLRYGWAGENIGWESGYSDPNQAAQYLNTQYMNSPEHKANILNPNFTDVGVGSATTAPGATWSGAGTPYGNVYLSVEDFASLPAPAPAATATPHPPTAAPIATRAPAAAPSRAPAAVAARAAQVASTPVAVPAVAPTHPEAAAAMPAATPTVSVTSLAVMRALTAAAESTRTLLTHVAASS